MKTQEVEIDHAKENALAWYQSIREWSGCIYMLEAGKNEDGEEIEHVEFCGDDYTDVDALREWAQESALSVEVREGWHTPGEEVKPEEYNILLSTGGPALRLRGKLSEHGEPTSARLEYQDWGTPWTDLFCDEHGKNIDLLQFAGCFYFGE